MSYFAGKTILLTGACGGLGQEFSKQLLEQGALLILTDIKFGPDSAQDHPSRGRILSKISADLSTREGVEVLLAEVKKTTPCPDIIINNAGIAHVGLFGEQPLDRWDKLMHVNLYAPMRICQYFLPDMKLRAQGHIVNISSIAGLVPLPGAAPYTASKYGLTGFSDAIREEYGRYGISVSSVHPFFTRTAILQSERFGTAIRNEPPWFLTESPESVVKEALLGIAAQQDYILPGVAAKAIDIIRRLNPRLISMIGRNMLQ